MTGKEGGPGCVPRLLHSAPAGPDTPPQRVAVAAANWQASPAHLLRAPLPGSAGGATAGSSDPVAALGKSQTPKTRPAQGEPVGGARGAELCPGSWKDPSFLPLSPIPFSSSESLEVSHSRHSKTIEHQEGDPGQPGQESSALPFLSTAYKDPRPPPRGYSVQAQTIISSRPSTQQS